MKNIKERCSPCRGSGIIDKGNPDDYGYIGYYLCKECRGLGFYIKNKTT